MINNPMRKPKEIDKINPLDKPVSTDILDAMYYDKERITEEDFKRAEEGSRLKKISEKQGDTEFLSDVMPKFINPIGILGMNTDYFRAKFEDDFESSQDKQGMISLASYRPDSLKGDRTMTVKDFANVTGNPDLIKEYRLVADNPSIEHEAIHRGMDLIRAYYSKEDIAKRFGEDTANFIYLFDVVKPTKQNKITGKLEGGEGNFHSEIITEINDARRLGMDDAQSLMNRFFYKQQGDIVFSQSGRVLKAGSQEQKEYMLGEIEKVLDILPNIEQLAKERLYDRNPKGGPTEDARGLPEGSLEEQIYGGKKDFYKPYEEGKVSKFFKNLKNNLRKLVTRQPDFEKASKQMPKEFNKGGATMERQMEMAFMEDGGLKDDGMDKDPISGNEVPSGSLAEEVRDDIPAQLSEGEYVVPADVVRFFGIKFFEDLRMQAKMGLNQMESAGRIGGEPIAAEVEITEETLDPKDEEKIRDMLQGFSEGAVVTDKDFEKDAEAKTFDPSKYATPGFSYIKRRRDVPTNEEIISGKKDGKVKYYHPDGREVEVIYVNGEIVNDDQLSFTQEPWSLTKPKVDKDTEVGSQTQSAFSSSQDEQESEELSDYASSLISGFDNAPPAKSVSTEDLARQYGGDALYYDKESNKVIKMTDASYQGLVSDYNRLNLEEKGVSFQQWYNTPTMTKIGITFNDLLGYEVDPSEITNAIKAANKNPKLFRDGIYGYIKNFVTKRTSAKSSKPASAIKAPTESPLDKLRKGDASFFTSGVDDEGNAVMTKDDVKKYYDSIGQGTLLGTTRADKFLLGLRDDGTIFRGKRDGAGRPIYEPVDATTLARLETNRRNVQKNAQQIFADQVAEMKLYSDPQAMEELAGKGMLGPDGRLKPLSTVEQVAKFDKEMKEAEKIARGSSSSTRGDGGDGPTDGGDSSGSSFGDGTFSSGETTFQSPQPSYAAPAPQATTQQRADAFTQSKLSSFDSSQPENFYGGFDKGGLASKPKAKAKRKKNTKGLGTKPKAT